MCRREWRPERKNILKASPSYFASSMPFTSHYGSKLSAGSGKYLNVHVLAVSLFFFPMYINKGGRHAVHMCGIEEAVDSAGVS